PWIEKQLTPLARALTQPRRLGWLMTSTIPEEDRTRMLALVRDEGKEFFLTVDIQDSASIELAVRAFARQLLGFWESLRLLPLEFPLMDLKKKFRARWRLMGWGGSREKRLKDLQEAFLLHWLGILRRQRVRCMSPGDLYVGLFVAAVILLTEEPRGKKCRQDKHLQILFALSQKCFEGVSLVQ
ncbi:hypothetical protein DFQ26_009634, partial [Actinomortierella ambigua]